ncbi:rhodanese-like domain-containing protein [Glutamicibacter sp. X7]
MTTSTAAVAAETLRSAMDEGAPVGLLLDVRTPVEFESKHIPGSRNIPLDRLKAEALEFPSTTEQRIVLICQSGNRATQAQRRLLAQGLDRCAVLAGGIASYEECGGTLSYGTRRWTLDRQMRLTAGSMVLLGLLGRRYAHRSLVLIAAAAGAGLAVSALRDSCPMIGGLASMPWNRTSTPADPFADIPEAGR